MLHCVPSCVNSLPSQSTLYSVTLAVEAYFFCEVCILCSNTTLWVTESMTCNETRRQWSRIFPVLLISGRLDNRYPATSVRFGRISFDCFGVKVLGNMKPACPDFIYFARNGSRIVASTKTPVVKKSGCWLWQWTNVRASGNIGFALTMATCLTVAFTFASFWVGVGITGGDFFNSLSSSHSSDSCLAGSFSSVGSWGAVLSDGASFGFFDSAFLAESGRKIFWMGKTSECWIWL